MLEQIWFFSTFWTLRELGTFWMRCVYLEIIEEISLPKLHLSQCYWQPRKQLAPPSHMQPSDNLIRTFGNFYLQKEFFRSNTLEKILPKQIFTNCWYFPSLATHSQEIGVQAIGVPWEAANILLRNFLPVIGNKFLTNRFSSAKFQRSNNSSI